MITTTQFMYIHRKQNVYRSFTCKLIVVTGDLCLRRRKLRTTKYTYYIVYEDVYFFLSRRKKIGFM